VRTAAILLLAVAIDLALGDPPGRLHPVAWIGAALDRGRRALCAGAPRRLLARGAAVTLLCAAAGAVVAAGVAASASRLDAAGIVLEAVALSLLLSLRGLSRAARSVAAPLARDDLAAARAAVGRHLVSRPTATLAAGPVASAAVESVAENLTDSFVAPALFYVAFGLPGVAVYRVINTADAMLGYHEGDLEWFGKTAARLDDVLNYAPARLAAVCLVVASVLDGAAAGRAWRVMRRDARRTASPNAGWTMAAMAGALGVTLEKTGAYRLGDGPWPDVRDIHRSVRLMLGAAGICTTCLASVAIYFRL
jgi:adenosylcobinamide-phosphate synthase